MVMTITKKSKMGSKEQTEDENRQVGTLLSIIISFYHFLKTIIMYFFEIIKINLNIKL